MEEVLGHVPKEQRLLYAVGVLLQSQTFPLSGVDLEKRLEELLELRGGKALAQELCVDLTDYPNVAQIEVTQLQHLVDEAADFVARQTAAFLQRLLIQYSGIPDLATSFKRASRDSHGLLHLVDLGPTPKKDVGACWVKTLSAIPGVTKEEVLQRLQMTAGQVRGLRPLPLSAALLRLANLPEQLIFDLRHRILSRHHSMSHIFETMAPHLRGLHGQGNLAKLILDDFRGSFQQVLDDDGGEDEDEAKLTTLFAACDTHQDGGIDQEELQQALSIAAPPANLSRLRTLAILQFGSWRAAFHSLGIGVEDPITEARFVALASNLDIAYEDAWAMFATLSPTGEPVTVPELSQHGSDFGLHEFALRVWLAGEAGSTLQDAAKRLHAPAFEGDLGLQRFREVCGLSEDGAASLSTASASLGTASKGLSSSKRIPSVKCHPPLTENEVTAAYAEFKAKYHSVTLGAIRSELESNTAFSNDRSSASIGETMVVRYRVPHALQSQLREHPFIALVPSNMAWMSGGGGCWMIGRTTPVTEMTGPKFSLNRNGEGVLRLQVWPGVSHLELGAADLRIFASPDGMAIGRQVGSSAMFQLRPPAPAKIMIEAASLTPTSTRLLWEAPNPPVSRPATESQFRYVVRGKAMGLDIEQEAVLQEQQVWSHLKKSTSKFLSHQVHGLLPGVRYQFQVHAFSKSKRGSFVDNSPRAGGSAAMAAATTAAPEGLESLASPGVEVTMPERPAPPRPSHAILVERGLGGSFTLRWAEHESGGGGQNAWGYEVFWTVPQDDEEPETAQKHVDHEDAFAPGEKSLVWRYPGPVFFRKPGDGTVEGLLHPPEADAVPLDEVSFCVRAVDPFSSGVTSPMGDLGPAVPLPSAAEAILREAEAMKLIGEGAVRAGGFKRFLEEAEDAGLIGTGSSSELDLRRVLYKKVEEAGGLKEVIEAMTDLQMKSFKDACEIVKAIQESTELTSEETPSWTQVVRLVAEAGGAKSFSRSLSSVELKEVLGNTQRLAALGIFQGKSEDHSLRDALFNEDTEKQMPQLFSKIQEALSGLALDERQVADLSKALGIMARSGGKVSWTDLVDVIVEQEGGPAPVQPLVKYCEGHAKDLHSALKGSLMDAEGMISFLKTAGEAEFIGHAADAAGREDFLTRLSEAGGASVLYSSLKEIDLKALLPAIMPVARAAKLHRESCLQVPAGSISRADAWHKLVEIVETKWGGPQAFLEKSGELYDSQRASAHERREGSEFDALVQDTGGRMAVSELLRWTADAGGVQHVLRALGPVQLSQVCNFLEALRRGGGQFQDLEKLATMVREVGGLTRLVRSMEKIQDPSKLIEIIDYGSTFERHGFVDHAKDREKHPEVLAKVMAETSINRFLKIFDGVRLSSLLDLVPLLVSAGVLRSKGQAQGEEEVAAAGGSVLRWLARAGGAFLVGSAVSQVEARSFVKLMEQVNQMGLGQLRPLGMMKVGAFLTDLSRRAGSLEDFMTSVGQLDLIHLVSTLNSWRQPAPSEREDDVPEQATEDASGALENVRSEASDVAIPGPSTPEEAQEVLEALEALRVVAQKESVRGIQRLVKDFQKVDRLERLERGIELLDKARLLPRLGGTSSAPKSDFEPWSHLVSIVNAFGGPEDFNKRVEAVNLQHFDECLDVLNAAGLTRKPGQEAMNSRDFSSAVSAWKEVVGILVTAGGPALFLESLKGIAVEDFLRMVGLLRQAGLARPLDDEDGVEMTRRPSFSYGYGESAGRIRNEMLQDFVQRVIQAGGFHAFWHALKGVDLMKLKGDLHCLAVIRRKLQELIAEDWWLAVHDAEGLEELLHSALAERKRRADDLTLKQRQQLVKRFREVGGVEAFLDGFANINLSQMLQQHKALHKARIRDVGVIEALSKIGELVKNKVEHLHGLQAVAATLVRWGDRHYRGEEPVRLWKAMHQQVTWLLMAIEENGALLKATVNHGNHPGKEPELTPARLAQFLQALRPVGGVPGFLAAFRGLDFPMAAAQARILHDACVRSKETTKRLAVIFGLLRFNLTQLRGLEHFLRNFVAPVFAEASSQAQTSQERLLVAERWQRLTSYLSQAAGRAEPGQVTEEPASGADQVLEVLMLGLRLSEAAGRKASKEDWEQLCQEIRSDPGLPGLLEKIRSPRRVSRLSGEPRATRGSLSAPSAFLVRTTLPPCYEDGPPLLPDAPVPVLPVARRVSRPQSAARSRSQVEPFRSHPVPGWSETTQ